MMLSLLLGGFCVLAGCAASPPIRPAISVVEIVSMAEEGATPDAIIEKIQASRSVYRLRASELVRLKQQGVPDQVLDYMEQTHLTEVCRQAIWDDSGDLYTARTIKDCS
jgi:hypothetical protein